MNWNNIKTFLIFLFLAVNIFLIVISVNMHNASKLTDKNINETLILLEKNNIKIDEQIIPRNAYSNNSIHLTDIYFSDIISSQNISRDNNQVVIILNCDWPKSDISEKLILQTLKKYGFDISNIQITLFDGKYIISSKFNDIPIFNNNLMVTHHDDKLVLRGNWYIAKDSYMWQQSSQSYATSALINFVSCPYRNTDKTSVITNIEYGYYAQSDNMNQNIKTISSSPCYRLTTDDGMMYYYSVNEGKFVK